VAISLEILEAYQSQKLKIALAKPITERKFRGINAVLAAEMFLKAAGIEALRKDAIKIALREAKKIVASDQSKINSYQKSAQMGAKVYRKQSAMAKK